MDCRILYVTLPLLAGAIVTAYVRKTLRRDWSAILGLACTLIGDYFLAMTHAPKDSPAFIYGVIGFCLAHCCWIVGFLREGARPLPPVFLGLLLALIPYIYCRVLPNAVQAVGVAIICYTVLSSISLSAAIATGCPFWWLAIGSLFISDCCITFGTFTDEPHLGRYVAPLYVLALVGAAAAIVFGKLSVKPPFGAVGKLRPMLLLALCLYALALTAFVIAMFATPDGHYNPLRQMLSYLGRRKIGGVLYPACHYWFMAGMLLSSLSIAVATPHFAASARRPWRMSLVRWCGAATAAGLTLIALVPEDVCIQWHNNGCYAAAAGGGGLMLLLWPRRWEWLVVVIGMLSLVGFQAALALHGAKVIPFSPAVPTMQKAVILCFMFWCVWRIIKLMGGDSGNEPKKKTREKVKNAGK